MLLLAIFHWGLSTIQDDECVIFFPSYAYEKDDQVVLEIHGWIYEPEDDSTTRNLLIKGILAFQDVSSEEKSKFTARMKYFLVDNEGNKVITIKVGSRKHKLKKSSANGHFIDQIVLSKEEFAEIQSDIDSYGYFGFDAVMPEDDDRIFNGVAQLIKDQGFSVISDIDDTIKHSNVLNKKELICNTFFKDFIAVYGMSELYANLAKKGVAFHYVSGSPWQLYPFLAQFLSDSGFPRGSVHLKNFRLKDSSIIKFITSNQKKYKLEKIQPILESFPERKFLLFGDSGEQDSAVYAHLAEKYPKQIAGIFIRSVHEKEPEETMNILEKLEVPWKIFKDPQELSSFDWDLMLANQQ